MSTLRIHEYTHDTIVRRMNGEREREHMYVSVHVYALRAQERVFHAWIDAMSLMNVHSRTQERSQHNTCCCDSSRIVYMYCNCIFPCTCASPRHSDFMQTHVRCTLVVRISMSRSDTDMRSMSLRSIERVQQRCLASTGGTEQASHGTDTDAALQS